MPNDDGALGRFDIVFGLKLPTAYAVALDAAPITGGGFLDSRDNEYRGALALKFETFGFAAFAILNTKLPGGVPGFSFVASIFGDFVLPLGYGFFLTGLGGVIGINRTVNTDALRQVLYRRRSRLDSVSGRSDRQRRHRYSTTWRRSSPRAKGSTCSGRSRASPSASRR